MKNPFKGWEIPFFFFSYFNFLENKFKLTTHFINERFTNLSYVLLNNKKIYYYLVLYTIGFKTFYLIKNNLYNI